MENTLKPAEVVSLPQDSILHKVTAHLDRQESPETVQLMQYDRNLPVIAVGLCYGGEPYAPPEGAAVHVRVKKPDRTSIYNPVLGLSEDRQTVYISVTEQMTAVQGTLTAILEIMLEDDVVGTAPIRLQVAGNPVRRSDVTSASEFQVLESFVEEARASAETAKVSEENAKASELAAAQSAAGVSEIKADAEVARDAAEAFCRRGEAAASGAEAAKSIAEAARDAARLARQEAENAQSAAEDARNQAQSAIETVTQQAASAAASAQTATEQASSASRAASTALAAQTEAEAHRQAAESVRQELEGAVEAVNAFAGRMAQQNDAITALQRGKIDGAFVEDGYLYLTAEEIVQAGPLGPFTGAGTPKYVVNYRNPDGKILYQALIPQGENAPDPVSEGYIETPSMEGQEGTKYTYQGFDALPENIQGNCDVTARYATSYLVSFMNGNELWESQWVLAGENAAAPSQQPERASTLQYTYRFLGWNTDPSGAAADGTALSRIDGPRTIYAIYSATACVHVTEIEDSWEEILAACADGTYRDKYTFGNYKPLDLGDEGIVNMQVVGFEADGLADESGNAPLSWLSIDLLKTAREMNERSDSTGGWEAAELRTYLRETIFPTLPPELQTGIKTVTKYQATLDTSGDRVLQSTEDTVWIPSNHEITGSTSYSEDQGPYYKEIFPPLANASRIKYSPSGTASNWWLRSVILDRRFGRIRVEGDANYDFAMVKFYIALGFCT